MVDLNRRVLWFVASWSLAAGVMLLPAFGPWASNLLLAPKAFFSLVVVAASTCVLTSIWVLSVGRRGGFVEVMFVGCWFLVLSVLPLVHGLTTPGVLYGPNQAFAASVLLAAPLAGIAAVPILFREARWANWLGRRVGLWVMGWAAGLLVLSTVMLVRPNLVPIPIMGSAPATAISLPTVGVAMLISWRLLTMAAISGSGNYIVVFLGFVLTGASLLGSVSDIAFGPTFWMTHIVDIVGVTAGTVGGAIAYRKVAPPSDLVGPILSADPLVALDLALDPTIDKFIADLNDKDPVTRDHVLRTAEAAMQVAIGMQLSPIEVRNTGIGAVLHDIGKLEIPDEILNKPGRLSEEEFAIMKTHAPIGGDLVGANPALEGVSATVRGHHERLDGRGYPDGLTGDQIPMTARIVAVCDAYDAMAHDRPYRTGMESEAAVAVLQEHAGAQWDPMVVKMLTKLVKRGRIRTAPTGLSHLGQAASVKEVAEGLHDHDGCGCLAALPDHVSQQVLSER